MSAREPFSNRRTPRSRRDSTPRPRVSGTRTGSTSVISARAEEKVWYKRGPVMFGITAVVAVVFSGIWNPPTTNVHGFTEASDYSASRDAGCTNSGDGCHGSEVEYTDFNDYHPDMTCTTCHDYEGVGCIPCHTPREHECAACHDGTMEGASDCVQLAEAYPNGHYRETTHTAMGTDFDQAVRAEESGEAYATCKDCHSRDLWSAHDGVPLTVDSPYGEHINCGECHNDVRNDGTTQVLSDWEDRSCEACHTSDSASPVHALDVAPAIETSGSAGCGTTGAGCHENDDLHALHPNSPQTCSGNAAEGEPGCHDLEVEAGVAQVEGCGGGQAGACHPLYRNDRFSHDSDRNVHSPETSYPARQTFEGVPCGDCHDMATDGRSLQTEHALATSARTLVSDDTCRNCHNHEASAPALADEWSARDTGESCGVCHDGRALDAAHESDLARVHDSSAGSEGCADSGIGCHDTAALAKVGSAPGIHENCLNCHDRRASDGNRSYTPGATTCGEGRDCHNLPGSFQPATSTHPGVNGNDAAHTAGRLQSTATLNDPASGLDVPCATCHTMALAAEHTRPNSAIRGDECAGCHNRSADTARIVAASWSESQGSGACAGCHDTAGMHDPHEKQDAVHVAVQIGHTGEPSDTGCARGGCHVSADVRLVHKDVGCDIAGCHTDTGDIAGSRKLTCGGSDEDSACHTSSDHHAGRDEKHFATELDRITGEPAPGSCAKPGCHDTTGVMQLHVTNHCSTAGCHVEGGPTYMSCGGPEGAAACHAGSNRHAAIGEKHFATELDRITGEPAPGSCAKPGCHETTDVRELHVTDHCYAAGCHVEGGPTYMSCGGPEGTASCHAGSDRHANIEEKHVATELASDGTPTPDSCVHSGCHQTNDVRELHVTDHCYAAGCHVEGGPTYMSCGGPDGGDSCHGTSLRHGGNHSADMTGTVDGIAYGPGENLGCFDCHSTRLTTEHSNQRTAGNLEGGGVNSCSICHWHEDDPGNNAYANLPAVEAAIAAKDRRCVACHSSSSGLDGPLAVAPPPSATCTATVVPARTLASVPDAGETVAPSAIETTVAPASPASTVTPAPVSVPSEAAPDRSADTSASPDVIPDVPTEEPESPDPSDNGCTFDPSAESSVTAESHSTDVCLTCHTLAPSNTHGS